MPRTTLAALPLAAVLALALAGCGSPDDAAQPEGSAPPAGEVTASASPAVADPAWYDEEERAAEDAEAATEIVWVTGWFVPEALEDPTVADLEPRYRKVSELAPDADAAERARAAFAALADAGPIDLINPMEGITLRLLSAKVEDRDGFPTAILDFDEGIAATNQLGSAGGAAAEAQFHMMVREYFPDASHVLVSVEGTGSELFHGKPYTAPVQLAQ